MVRQIMSDGICPWGEFILLLHAIELFVVHHHTSRLCAQYPVAEKPGLNKPCRSITNHSSFGIGGKLQSVLFGRM